MPARQHFNPGWSDPTQIGKVVFFPCPISWGEVFAIEFCLFFLFQTPVGSFDIRFLLYVGKSLLGISPFPVSGLCVQLFSCHFCWMEGKNLMGIFFSLVYGLFLWSKFSIVFLWFVLYAVKCLLGIFAFSVSGLFGIGMKDLRLFFCDG